MPLLLPSLVWSQPSRHTSHFFNNVFTPKPANAWIPTSSNDHSHLKAVEWDSQFKKKINWSKGASKRCLNSFVQRLSISEMCQKHNNSRTQPSPKPISNRSVFLNQLGAVTSENNHRGPSYLKQVPPFIQIMTLDDKKAFKNAFLAPLLRNKIMSTEKKSGMWELNVKTSIQ